MQIPDDVIEEVTAALNMAIALALRFEPALQPTIMATAQKLDDAINAAEMGED